PLDDGLLKRAARVPGCTPPTDNYIVDIKRPDRMRMSNHTGALADTFSSIAQLGDQGCGYEAQLEGMKRALDVSRPENAGFLRPGACLAVVIIIEISPFAPDERGHRLGVRQRILLDVAARRVREERGLELEELVEVDGLHEPRE